MEWSNDQSSTEGSQCTGNGATFMSAACKPKHKNKLRRHHSMEDIPAELKSTQNRTISIFLEYVRNRSVLQKTSTEKQTMHCHSDSLPRVDASADHIESGVIEVVPPPSRRKRCIRRLQSEPHGETSQVRVVVENALETASELAETPDSEDGDQPLCSTAKSRPSTLSLSSAANASVSGPNKASDLSVKPSSPKHKRMPSNCESITTPVPDPPLFSPASVSALEATYPPARDYFSRSRSSSSPLPLPYDWQRHQVACASFELHVPGMDPQNARIIAERLKMIGDKLEQEHGEEHLSNIVNSLLSLGTSQPITISRFLSLLSHLRSRLDWKKVSEVFVLGYRLLEIMTRASTKPFEDERWGLFESLWDFMVNTVARWVMENGGWGAFLLATECFEAELTSHRGGSSPGSPGVAAAAARARLWSLSESGSIVDEDGISLSETITGNEGSAVCSHAESNGTGNDSSCSHASEDQTFATEASASGELSTSCSPPSSTLSLEHDSGIVSSMEHLSLDTQDTEGHFSSISGAVSDSEDLAADELQESDPVMGAGTATSPTDEFDGELQPFDRNRSRSLPVRGRGGRSTMPPRRASEKALDGLLYTVNIGVSAAFVYAVVSSLLNK